MDEEICDEDICGIGYPDGVRAQFTRRGRLLLSRIAFRGNASRARNRVVSGVLDAIERL
jgi:hypothetical protein